MPALASLVCGFVFGVGLLVSGMVQPAKVLGFLDVLGIPSGAWDPSLAVVMAAAVADYYGENNNAVNYGSIYAFKALGGSFAGLLVGFGTRLANGCTSGHGVCGIARLSARSITATAVFMATAIIVVALTRHLVGG